MRTNGGNVASAMDFRLVTLVLALGAAVIVTGCSYTPQTMTTSTQQTTSQVIPGQTSVTVSKTQQSP